LVLRMLMSATLIGGPARAQLTSDDAPTASGTTSIDGRPE
jgi:hypothetical protein